MRDIMAYVLGAIIVYCFICYLTMRDDPHYDCESGSHVSICKERADEKTRANMG